MTFASSCSFLLSLFLLSVLSKTTQENSNTPTLAEKRAFVVQEFLHGYKAYKEFAWGSDELKPISKGPSDFILSAATIVSSLDTMFLMGLESELHEAREWILYNYTLNTEKSVSIFETNIRIIGGFLSAYTLTADSLFLLKAQEVAESLLPAFDTQSGAPPLFFAPGNPTVLGKQCTLASAGTLQLEFCYLSLLTSNKIFCEKAMKFYSEVQELKESKAWGIPLYPLVMSNGQPSLVEDGTLTIGAKADSFYEYLLKVWLWDEKGNEKLEQMWRKSVSDINSLLVREYGNYSVIGKIEFQNLDKFTPEMEHLSCFYGGMLALASGSASSNQEREKWMGLAKKIAYTCYRFYETSPQKVSADSYNFNNQTREPTPQNPAYYLRPETLETLFYLWRTTHDPIYRTWAWEIVQNLRASCRVPHGYSGIKNIQVQKENNKPNNFEDPVVAESTKFFTDRQEAFLFSETFKYAFLIFSEDNIIPIDEFVFNTEAHPFLRKYSYQSGEYCMNCQQGTIIEDESVWSFVNSQTLAFGGILTGIVFLLYFYTMKKSSTYRLAKMNDV